MLTVRYPNGTTVDYNRANFFTHDTYGWHLWEKKNSVGWVVSIQLSAGVAIEARRPCAVHDGTVEAIERIAQDTDRLRTLPWPVLEPLKRALRDFNIQTGRWKR